MKLSAWAEHQFRDVDQDGVHAVRVRLVSADGNATWQVWERDELSDPVAWADEAETYLRELGEELPQKQVQMLFIAEDREGNERAQFPRTIKGRNRAATDAVFRSEPKAIAEAMDQTAKTMGRILESANVQIEVLTKTVRDQAEQTYGLLEFIRELNTQQALSAQESRDAMAELISGAKEYVPTVLSLLTERMLRKPNGKIASSAAKVVADVLDKENKV